jgi:predicted transglutaminase-like cysteine proteinase
MENQQQLEEFWNKKRPTNTIAYTGRAVPAKCPTCNNTTLKEQLQIDVKTMLTPNDAQVKLVIDKYKLKGTTHDETVWNIQKWITKNIQYIGDDLSKCTMEYWQFPFETIADKTGDCEDGALLIAALAINAGVPAFRVRVVAGMVQPAPTAPQGGHGYVSYLRESDNQWVIIDWCYLEDSAVSVEKKILHKSNSLYKEVWFSFNHLYSWAEQSMDFKTF